MLPLLCLGTVLAHYPHDVATWVAVSPGAEPAWVATSLWRTEAWMVARSANGLDLDVRYMMSGEDRFVSAGAFVGDDGLLLATEGHGLWRSEDAGETWEVDPDFGGDGHIEDLVASPEVHLDGLVIAVGADAWVSADAGETWVGSGLGPSGLLVDIDLSPVDAQAACAIDEGGALFCTEDGGASWDGGVETGLVEPWGISLGGDGTRWVATDRGLFACTSTGDCAVTDLVEVTTVVEELASGTLLAAGVREAVWRSEDGGATWEAAGSELESAQEGQGGPREEEHYFEFREAADGRVYLASWEGIARSADDGVHWERIPTARQRTVRSLVLGRSGQGLVALLASYGGGAFAVSAEGARSLSWDSDKRYLRHVGAGPDFGEDGFAAILGAGTAHGTLDGGDTWTEWAVDLTDLQRLDASADLGGEGAILVVGRQVGRVRVATSRDLGESWAVGEMGEPCAAGPTALSLSASFELDGFAWTACEVEGLVYETEDGGATWAVVADLDETVFTVAGVADGLRFIGSLGGLLVLDQEGEEAAVHFAGHQVQHVAVSPQFTELPVVVAAVADQGWWLSEDGGQTFSALDTPSSAYPLWTALSPDLAEDHTLAIAGFGGAWLSTDLGQTWSSLRHLELHEEDSQWLVREGTWSRAELDGASGGLVRIGETGDLAQFRFRGVGVRMHAAGAAATVSLSLDGVGEILTLDTPESTVAWVAGDLTDDWHTLTLSVDGGSLQLDAFEVSLTPEAEGVVGDGPSDTGGVERPAMAGGDEGCGCGGGAAWVFLLPLGVARRRRTRTRRPDLSSPVRAFRRSE